MVTGKGDTDSKINEDEVQKKIEYVDENLWGKLEKSGKRISFAKDILALYSYMKGSIGQVVSEKQSLWQR